MENKLSAVSKRLVASHNLLVAGRVFFEIFFNVFIWKQTSDIAMVGWFNIVYLLTHVIIFTLFAKFVKEGKIHLPRKIGLIGFAIVYFAIYLLGVGAVNYIIPIAIAIGIFNGMYWVSYQTLRFDLTNTQNRANYVGVEAALKIMAEIVIPALGGFIIAMNFMSSGYANIFLLGGVLFLISFFVGNVRPKVSVKSKFSLRKTFAIIRKSRDIWKTNISYSFSSFSRTGAIVKVLLPIFIFDVLHSELHLGVWLSVFSVFSMIASVTMGRLHYNHHKILSWTGGILFVLLILSIAFYPTLIIYVIFGIFSKFIILMVGIPKRVVSENLVHTVKNYNHHRVEYFVIREWFNILFGRIFGFVLVLFAAGLMTSQMKIILIVMAIAVVFEVAFQNSVKMDPAKV